MVIKSSAFYQGQAQRSDLAVSIALKLTVIGQDPPLGTPLLCHRSWCGFGHPTPNAYQWVGSDGLTALLQSQDFTIPQIYSIGKNCGFWQMLIKTSYTLL